jgi:hypothetical protein
LLAVGGIDYDLRTLVKLVVASDAYQRGHAPADADEPTRLALEENVLATPMRRMIAESLYDSVVTAGHLFEVKHASSTSSIRSARSNSKSRRSTR